MYVHTRTSELVNYGYVCYFRRVFFLSKRPLQHYSFINSFKYIPPIVYYIFSLLLLVMRICTNFPKKKRRKSMWVYIIYSPQKDILTTVWCTESYIPKDELHNCIRVHGILFNFSFCTYVENNKENLQFYLRKVPNHFRNNGTG